MPQGTPAQPPAPEQTVRLHEEVLSVGTRAVERDRVRIKTTVREHEESVDQDLDRDEVEVTRVPIGRPVDQAPEPRREGDVLIVPVLEEELVVTKRLVLKEELHIRKHTARRTERVTATLRSEEAVVERAARRDDAPEPRETSKQMPEQE